METTSSLKSTRQDDQKQKTISVIIPTLNEQAPVGRAIESAQAAGADEIIVVDGGSTDQTTEVALQYGAIVLSAPRGRGPQQNVGAKHAQGEILLFLHADNWLAPTALSQIRQQMENPNISHGAFRQQIDSSGLPYRLLEIGNLLRVKLLKLPYGDQGIFIRKALFEQLGMFPEYPIMEDWTFMRTVRKIYRPVLLTGPIYVSARRWKKVGVLRQTWRNWRLVLACLRGKLPPDLETTYPPHQSSQEGNNVPQEPKTL